MVLLKQIKDLFLSLIFSLFFIIQTRIQIFKKFHINCFSGYGLFGRKVLGTNLSGLTGSERGTFLKIKIFSTCQKYFLLKTYNTKSQTLRKELLKQRSLSYRNQSIDLQRKSMDWFLYDRDLRHERVKESVKYIWWRYVAKMTNGSKLVF